MKKITTALMIAALAAVAGIGSTTAGAAVSLKCSTTPGAVGCSQRIPDAVGAVSTPITSTMTIAGCPSGAPMTSISVFVDISHTWVGDLQVSVTGPNNVTIPLLSNLPDDTGSVAGCQGNNVNATFSDIAAPPLCSTGLTGNVKPVSLLAPFSQIPVAGSWSLTVKDTQNSSDGVLNDWAIVATCMPLDIDGNKAVNGLSDGLMVLRYLFGITGAALTNGAIENGATRTDPVAIKQYLDDIRPLLDVDGNGQVDALTDGLLILRYLMGLRGDSLIGNAVGTNATRSTAPQIEAYMLTLVQ